MAISPTRAVVRSPFRVRVFFTNTLAMEAFDVSWFSILSGDDYGMDPTPVAALVVSDDPTALELALDEELVGAGRYTLTIADGLPAVDASTVDGDTDVVFTVLEPQPPPSPTLKATDLEDFVYGEDVRIENGDMVELPNGDLAPISGPENAFQAIHAAMLANGRPWDDSYGARARKYVGSSPLNRGALATALMAAGRRDDRVRDITAIPGDDDGSGDLDVEVLVELIGGERQSMLARP